MDMQTMSVLIQLTEGLIIIIGLMIAVIQIQQLKKQRKEAATIEFFNAWQTPEFTKAVNELQYLPDRVAPEELRSKHPEMEDYAFLVSGFFESAGVLVKKQIIPFHVVEDLIGGIIIVTWKKLGLWIEEWRRDKNPRMAEWFEWLKSEIEKTGDLQE